MRYSEGKHKSGSAASNVTCPESRQPTHVPGKTGDSSSHQPSFSTSGNVTSLVSAWRLLGHPCSSRVGGGVCPRQRRQQCDYWPLCFTVRSLKILTFPAVSAFWSEDMCFLLSVPWSVGAVGWTHWTLPGKRTWLFSCCPWQRILLSVVKFWTNWPSIWLAEKRILLPSATWCYQKKRSFPADVPALPFPFLVVQLHTPASVKRISVIIWIQILCWSIV